MYLYFEEYILFYLYFIMWMNPLFIQNVLQGFVVPLDVIIDTFAYPYLYQN